MQVPEGNERAELKCQCATRFKTGIEEKKIYIYTYHLLSKSKPSSGSNTKQSKDSNQVQLGTRKAAGKGLYT